MTTDENWKPRVGNFMKHGVHFQEKPLSDKADQWRVDFDWNAIQQGKKVAGSVSISLEVIGNALFDWRDTLARECRAHAQQTVANDNQLASPSDLAKSLLPPMTRQTAFDLYREQLEELLVNLQLAAAPMPLASVIGELHTSPRMAHMPQVNVTALRGWLHTRQIESQSKAEYRRFLVATDSLNRFEVMAEQFAEWWAQQTAPQ